MAGQSKTIESYCRMQRWLVDGGRVAWAVSFLGVMRRLPDSPATFSDLFPTSIWKPAVNALAVSGPVPMV